MSILECKLTTTDGKDPIHIKFNPNKHGSYCGVHAIVDNATDYDDPEPMFTLLQKQVGIHRRADFTCLPLNMQVLAQRITRDNKERKLIARTLAKLRTMELHHPEHVVICRDSDLPLKAWTLPKVIEIIEDAFPEMQLIILTSNPYLISTLYKERVYIYKNDSGLTTQLWQTRGCDAEDIIAWIFNDDTEVNVPERQWVDEYAGIAAQDLHDTEEGKDLFEKIVNHFGKGHVMTMRANSATTFAEAKRRIFKRKDEST